MSEYMIMLNSVCNLQCSYCFAMENMGASSGEITEQSFDIAVNFGLQNSTLKGIGIIGGEPMLHSSFDKFMGKLICDDRVESVDVFTNGTELKEHLSTFTKEKMHVLINCNSPSDIGNRIYNKVLDGIDSLFAAGIPIDRVGLGVNIYDDKQDLSYFLSLVDRYEMDTVRVSVSVPMSFAPGGTGRFQFFHTYLNQTKNFVRALFDRGVIPIFDCNKIPPCLLRVEEAELKARYEDSPKSWQAVMHSNYLNGLSRCTPSIVVDQELNAIRCFAVSAQTRCKIADFVGLRELQAHYEESIDLLGYQSDHPDCHKCQQRVNRECMGGCLIFKTSML